MRKLNFCLDSAIFDERQINDFLQSKGVVYVHRQVSQSRYSSKAWSNDYWDICVLGNHCCSGIICLESCFHELCPQYSVDAWSSWFRHFNVAGFPNQHGV
jgi:hypothetical protein